MSNKPFEMVILIRKKNYIEVHAILTQNMFCHKKMFHIKHISLFLNETTQFFIYLTNVLTYLPYSYINSTVIITYTNVIIHINKNNIFLYLISNYNYYSYLFQVCQ